MGDEYNNVYRRLKKLKRIARKMKDVPEQEQDRKKLRKSIRKIKEKLGLE